MTTTITATTPTTSTTAMLLMRPPRTAAPKGLFVANQFRGAQHGARVAERGVRAVLRAPGAAWSQGARLVTQHLPEGPRRNQIYHALSSPANMIRAGLAMHGPDDEDAPPAPRAPPRIFGGLSPPAYLGKSLEEHGRKLVDKWVEAHGFRK